MLVKLTTKSDVRAKLLQSWGTLSNAMDCSLPGSSVHGILQARNGLPFPSGDLPRDQTRVSYISCIGRWVLYHQHHLGSLLNQTHPVNFYSQLASQGFPDSSVDKESACNAGDPGLITGLGRSPGEGIGYPLQYSWASLVAQLVKNPPAMWETWVQSLGWEDPLGKGKATTLVFWPGEFHGSIGSQRVGHN